MSAQESKTIEGLEVTVVKLEPVAAYMLLARVGPVLLPALLASKGVQLTGGIESLAPAAKAMLDGLTPEAAKAIMLDVFQSTSVIVRSAGEPRRYDLCGGIGEINKAFAGKFKGMLAALWFAIGVQFADFFAASDLAGSATPTPSP